MKAEDFEIEYSKKIKDFERLRLTTLGMIQSILNANLIEYLSIESRVKSCESAIKKSNDKEYVNPFSDNTDFVVMRIILFLERDIDRTASLLSSLFEIDSKNSVDKRTREQVDTVGYRSLHLVCKLGEIRKNLPEYSEISEQPFEIQIRTALQHAWAEIEHKRRYKGKFSLPYDLQHRLMIISGTLELVDREFSEVATKADEYASNLINNNDHTSDSDVISVVAAQALYERYIENYGNSIKIGDSHPNRPLSGAIVNELIEFGIDKVDRLRALIESLPPNLISIARSLGASMAANKFYRIAMFNSDFDGYFDRVKSTKLISIDPDNLKLLENLFKRNDLEEYLKTKGVKLTPS
ncbi:GTP pyrophosphokinase [Cypionkella sinensis]|uniref:GTP pyrophosphokinase family protein n=1 Tax=Cypionkella sinensis TaxID=1756043 RepID=A0ABV7J028_9RHOB